MGLVQLVSKFKVVLESHIVFQVKEPILKQHISACTNSMTNLKKVFGSSGSAIYVIFNVMIAKNFSNCKNFKNGADGTISNFTFTHLSIFSKRKRKNKL